MKKVNCTSISVDNDGMRRASVPQLLKEPYAKTCSNSRLIFCTRKQNIEYRKSMNITEQASKERYTSLINLISLRIHLRAFAGEVRYFFPDQSPTSLLHVQGPIFMFGCIHL